MASPSSTCTTTQVPLVPLFFETNPPSPASVPCPFFNIPLEIRAEIYSLLFSGVIYRFFDGTTLVEAVYGSSLGITYANALPCWLLTCKGMLADGLSEFYRQSKCVDFEVRGDNTRIPTMPFRLLSLCRLRKFDLSGTMQGVQLRYFGRPQHKLNGYQDAWPWPEEQMIGSIRGYIGPQPISRLKEFNALNLCQLLRGCNHGAKDLKLRFTCSQGAEISIYPEHNNWVVDLSDFLVLGSTFERVEFVITPLELLGQHLAHATAIAQQYAILQRNLEQLGKCLIGVKEGEKLGWAATEWWVDTANGLSEWTVVVQRTGDAPARRQIQGGLRSFLSKTGSGRVCSKYVMLRDVESVSENEEEDIFSMFKAVKRL